MKSKKHVFTALLALAMIFSLSASAFATNPTSQNMQVEYTVPANYIVYVPDGGNNLVVNPNTRQGEMNIGIRENSVIPGNKAIQMSVNAGTHYDDTAKSYRLQNGNGGQLLNYVLSYKGAVKNPNSAQGKVVLETVSAANAFNGFQGKIGVSVDVPKAAGVYTDTLTFTFGLVDAV